MWVLGIVAAVVVGVPLVVGVAFLTGMRTKSPLVVDAVRRFNRRTNKRVMRTAGTAGAKAAIIEHVGRSSGRPYRTPIGTMKTDDGFLTALPYGTRADWLKNVLAAGKATIVEGGVTYDVDQPAVVATADILHELPRREQRMLRLFRVEKHLRVRARPTE